VYGLDRVRENHKVVKKVIQLAIGVSEAGYREVLGIRVARQQIHAMLKYMYDAPTKEKALKAAEEIMDFLEERYPEAMELLDNAKEDILAVYALPAHCRKKMRTKNMTERTNEEIRRRERVIRIFPNDASARMLTGAYLQELSEE